MNHPRRAALLLVAALAALGLLSVVALAGCGGSAATTTTSVLPATTTTGAPSTATSGPSGAAPARFEIPLSGDQTVPPVQTSATGTFIIMLEASPNRFNISFELDVTNIVDVTAAHIHLGAAGANGPVIVPLFSGPQKSGSFTGVLAKGALTEADLTGPMAGKTFADLAALVLGGQTYVNVHTVANPNGEIRGQIVVPGAAGLATTTTADGGTTTTTAGTATTAGSGY